MCQMILLQIARYPVSDISFYTNHTSIKWLVLMTIYFNKRSFIINSWESAEIKMLIC